MHPHPCRSDVISGPFARAFAREACHEKRAIMTNLETYKLQAAEHALQYIQSGMVVGLGSGSIASHLVRALAAQLRDGRLHDIVGVPTSEPTTALAGQLGLPLATHDERPQIDIAL